MAEVAEMGEVDDVHSSEEGIHSNLCLIIIILN